jgi:hypothetical protein
MNGWVRIGIVASVIWMIIGAMIGGALFQKEVDEATHWTRWRDECLVTNSDRLDCNQIFNERLARALEIRRISRVIVALAPIPFAWLSILAIVAVVRWVRAGFSPNRPNRARQ